jgi:uncharacterized protein YuzE
MKITYDAEGDVLYIYLNDHKPVDNIDIEENIISYDLDKDGHLVGIEILDASKRVKDCSKIDFIHYPKPIKKPEEEQFIEH